MEDAGRGKLDQLLLAMKTNPKASLDDLAKVLNLPNKGVAFRMMQKLLKEKLVTMKGRHYELTKKGDEEVEAIESGSGKTQSPKVVKKLEILEEREKAVFAHFPDENDRFWMPKSVIVIKPEKNEDGTCEVTIEAWWWISRKETKGA